MNTASQYVNDSSRSAQESQVKGGAESGGRKDSTHLPRLWHARWRGDFFAPALLDAQHLKF